MRFQEEYNHFSTYYSNFTDVISIVNNDGYLVFINFTMSGKIEDYIGKHIDELNSSDNSEVNTKIFNLFETGIPFTTEYEVNYQGINSTFKSNNFKVSVPNLGDFVISMTREVNKNVHFNDKENKYNLLLQNQEYIVFKFKYINDKFVITSANDFAFNALQHNNNTFNGTDLNSLFFEIDKEFILNHLAQKENFNQTFIRQINGDIFKSEIIISINDDYNKLKLDNLLQNGFNNISQNHSNENKINENSISEYEFQIIAQDTNLRAQLKLELIESHNQLNEIILNLGKLICVINEENSIVYANSHFYDFFELNFENLQNFNLLNYFEKNYKLDFYYKNKNGFSKNIENGNSEEIYEYEILNKNNAVKFIEVKIQPISYGNLTNCKLILIDDITTTKENYIGYKEKNRFKELMESMPLMIHSLNENNEIIEVSNYWLAKLGYSYEEVIGQHTYDFMTLESKTFALKEIVPNYYEQSSLSNLPYTFITKSGELVDVLMTILILKDEFNNKRSLSISFDVTDKNILLKQIQQNETLLNTIFEDAPYGIELLNTKGDKLKVNKKTIEIADSFEIEINYKAEDNELMASMDLGNSFYEAINGNKQLIQNLAIDFGKFSRKKGLVPKEDLIGIYDMYLNPIINPNNEVENIICFLDDKTQVIKYQNQLEFQSLILQNINDIVVALDENLNIIYWNEVAEKTYGFKSKETLGKKIEEFYSFRWIDDNDVQKSLKAVREKGYWKGEIIHITKEGKELFIETNTTNIIDKNGEFKGILAVNRDITIRKEHEFALIRNKNLIDTIFDNSPTAIQIYDAEGYSVRMNEAHMKYIGLPDITVGVGVYNVLQDENLKYTGLNRLFEKAFNGEIVEVKGQVIDFSIYDGYWETNSRKKYIDLSILPLLDENNNVNSVVSFITDITERHENELKIIESEAQFRLLTENTTDLIINYNSEGKITYVSPSVSRVLGYSIDELINTEYSNLFNGSKLTKIGSNFGKNFIFGNELANVEYKFENKKGEFIYLDTLIKPIVNDYGDLVNVITYSRDITERVSNELKLQESNRLMNAMSEIANIGGWELDVISNTTNWTEQVYKIHNISNNGPHSVDDVMDHYLDDSKTKLINALDLAINQQIPYDLIVRFKDAKNNLKWVRTTAIPIVDNGKVVKLYGSFQDITESYEKDRKISENEDLLKSIYENVDEAIFRTTVDKGAIFVNNATLEMFGFKDINELNEFGLQNVYKNKNDRIKLVLQLAKLGQVSKVEVEYRRKNGTTFWGLNSTIKSIDENGNDIFDGAIVDITDRKNKEELLNKLNQNLELMVEERTNELRLTQEKLLDSFIQEKEFLELKSKFITLVSHEYRTPLTIIQTSLYLLEKFYEKGKTEQFQNQISRINDAIESMTVLLDNVLTLGTYDLNAVKKYLQEIDFINLITEIIEMQLQINKDAIVINFESNLKNALIITDKTMVYQIINNLIENSIKFSDKNKNIDIFVEMIDKTELKRSIKNDNDFKYIRCIVKDYGIGISKENLEKISEPFFRGDNVSEIRGLGLGLSISHSWVKILEGNLIFESEVGSFTTATLELPVNYPKGDS